MGESLASKIQYSKLCEVYEKISKARGNKKIEELRKFLNFCRQTGKEMKKQDSTADVSLFPIMRLFLPAVDRERGPHGLKQKTLADLFVRVFCLGKNSSDGKNLLKYKAPEQGESGMGDFAEKLFWVLNRRHSNVSGTALSIEDVNTALDEIARRNAENQSKDEVFLRLIKQLGAFELKWLTRTILKDVKLGLGQKKVFEAYHPNGDELFGEKSNLREVCDLLLDENYRVEKSSSNVVVLWPFKPMLLERCSIEEVGKFFTQNETYFSQTKYDGERSQIHMKEGVFKYYTRHGTDITNNPAYGETKNSSGFLTKKISSLLNPDCRSIILDGELMGWHKDRKSLGSKGMPFDVKKLTANSRHQPCFVAFDIVMYNDRYLLNSPYKDRLSVLNNAFREEEGVLLRSKIDSISSSAQLLEIFNKSIDTNEEGIVLKRSDGLYKPNTREGSGCYKIKAEYSEGLIQDLDLLILGGYYGEGKCAGIFSSFLVGVAADEKSSTKKFYSVVSVSTGLSMEKMRELDAKFKAFWTKDCPSNVVGPKKNQPDAWIHPKNSLILQLRATELTRCNVHPAGYTLRFPRVVKVRDDKPWEDAWTLKELRAMVKDGGFVQKATKRHATSSDIRDVNTKMPRNVRPAPMRIDTKYLGVKTSLVTRLTRLFSEKEFCVMNGEEGSPNKRKLSKNDIELLLCTHGAKIVQNPGNETFAVIVGNPKSERVKNVVKTRKWDVVSLAWLKRVTDEKNWHRETDFFPWEIISGTEATEQRLANLFDCYGDSYTVDADVTSLKRSFDKVEEEMMEKNSQEIFQHEDVEAELFENGISPFSLFRKMVGYFDDPSDTTVWNFKFMRGQVSDEIDHTVSHVFINERAISLINLYKKINSTGSTDIKIVNSSWIQDCCQQERLLPEGDYIIA
ncbi:DNA ligase 4 [Venturia canescens]|uniref:DNA ligase 4 n=1 Tax=Venturia canescens TaxID=32260 RepID=UPI001C9C0702|nr:DNA ligase 4 [Venturia canescens]